MTGFSDLTPTDRAGARGTTCDVVIIDDHLVLAQALASTLRQRREFGVVSVDGTLAGGRELLREMRPQVVVLDVRLGSDDGLELLREITATLTQTRVVVLTANPRPDVTDRARRLGACAVLPKGIDLDDLIGIILKASRGERIDAPDPADPGLPKLTVREIQILELLAGGDDPRGVAKTLGLSHHTVRDHIKNVRQKLGVQNQLTAVVVAARAGLIELPA